MSDLDILRELTGQLRPPGYDDLVAVARKRRRRFVVGVVIGAAVVVLGVGVAGAALSGGQRALAPAHNPSPNQTQSPGTPFDTSVAVFSVGTTVYLEDARTRVHIDDQGIRSLQYTSAGVLVRHGNNGEWDGGGPQRFSLIGPNGRVDRLNLTLRDRLYATEPSQPYLAYLEQTDDGYEVVVRDLRDDAEIARTALPPDSIGDRRQRPEEVSLNGSDVFVSTFSSVFVVDWRTGSVTDIEAPQPVGYWSITAGRSITAEANTMGVVDVRTGDVLLPIPRSTATGGEVSLSPDGRFVVTGVWGLDHVRQVYDIDTGEHVTIPEHNSTRPTTCQSCGLTQYGWTGEGDLIDLTKDVLRVCDSATGTCTSRPHGITLNKDGWQSLQLPNW
jgi:hypothetical protein